ncbi:adenosine receptor A2a-like [Pecten maximus]|uniref:adenosine receptor A2a-like n=1 Tax=Pecten maximus TaxID=6579 RepID=UPI0014587342|nr:adenosine receptor A2a-like [Pecten maximus]
MDNLNNTSFKFSTTKAVDLKTFLMPLGALVIVINAFSAAALLRCKHMEAKLRQFAVCLTAIDTCVGFNLLFMVLTYASNVAQNTVPCYIVLMMPRFTAYVGIFTTTAFAIDRFASIYRWHSSFITKEKTKAFCVVVWIFSFILTPVSFHGKNYTCVSQDQIDYDRETHALFMIIPMLVCFVTISVCYIAIYINIRKHLRKTKDLGVSMKEYALTMFQSTLVIGVVIFAYLLCYGPISILKIYNFVYPDTILPTRTIRNVTQVIFVTNSLINPIIYSVRFKECRLELKNIFCYFNKDMRNSILQRKKMLQAPFLENGRSGSSVNSAGYVHDHYPSNKIAIPTTTSCASLYGKQISKQPAVPPAEDEHIPPCKRKSPVEEHSAEAKICSHSGTCSYNEQICSLSSDHSNLQIGPSPSQGGAESVWDTDISTPDDTVSACSAVEEIFLDSLV